MRKNLTNLELRNTNLRILSKLNPKDLVKNLPNKRNEKRDLPEEK